MVKVEIKIVKLSSIKLNENNPRTITEKDMTYLVKSLQEFPDMMKLREIIVDEDMMILGGNMRYLGLQQIGAKDCIAKIVKGLTPEQKKEFIIKDNSMFGAWDMDILGNEWSDLPLAEWGLELSPDWFTPEEEEPQDTEPQIDKAEELNKIWKVKMGDLWQIGDHRLLCGDSTKAQDVKRVMGGERAGLCLTDPPYGVDYAERNIARDGNAVVSGNYHESKNADLLAFLLHCSGDVVVMTYPIDRHFFALSDWIKSSGFEFKRELVWIKSRPLIVLGSYYNQQHEPIMLLVRKGKPINAHTPNNASTVFETEKVAVQPDHPTARPIELWCQLMSNHSSKGESIYDPFLGSGTTMVACQNLDRKCRGIEISPAYCAVTLQRMKDAFPDIEIRRIKP